MKTTFPNIYKVLGTDENRPTLSYAIIEDGKIVATNGKILIFSDFSNYVINPELSENKVFDKDLLKWMSKKDFYQLECTHTGIVAYSTKGMEEKPYSGYFEVKEITKDYGNIIIRPVFVNAGKREIGGYPNWKSAIPCDSDYTESKEIERIGFDMNLLKMVSDSFAYDSKETRLKFEFCGANKPFRVSPLCSLSGEQQAMLYPIELE